MLHNEESFYCSEKEYRIVYKKNKKQNQTQWTFLKDFLYYPCGTKCIFFFIFQLYIKDIILILLVLAPCEIFICSYV